MKLIKTQCKTIKKGQKAIILEICSLVNCLLFRLQLCGNFSTYATTIEFSRSDFYLRSRNFSPTNPFRSKPRNFLSWGWGGGGGMSLPSHPQPPQMPPLHHRRKYHAPSCSLQIQSRTLGISREPPPRSTQPLQGETLWGNQFMADFILCQVNCICIPVLLAQVGRNSVC